MGRARPAAAGALLTLALSFSCGTAPAPRTADVPRAPAPKGAADVDYLIVAPRALAPELAPLVQLREKQGHVVALLDAESTPDAAGLQAALREADARAHGKLRYVLLAGDVQHPTDSAEEAPRTAVPTFYLEKMPYEHHSPEEHRNPNAITLDEHRAYPSDRPYETAIDGRVLAVGRVPARTPEDMRGFVRKVVEYELAAAAPDPDPEWRRRLTLFAGAANFGAQGDALLESIAEQMLDDELSDDVDLRFTFAKYPSPYASRFDRMRERFVKELDEGALFAGYVGHGAVSRFAPAVFRGGYFDVGTTRDAEALRIARGKPVFFSIACDTGAFDRPDGERSVAEAMVLNPEGPVAVFAASRESHPYPNALLGLAVLHQLVGARPATLGEGILAVKREMRESSIGVAEALIDVDVDALKTEHEGLYNLLGDPAMRLAYPDLATVTLGAGEVAARSPVSVQVGGPRARGARLVVTIETDRDVVRGPIVGPTRLASMDDDDAETAIDENHARANDKIVAEREVAPDAPRTVTLDAPDAPGHYLVKVLAVGENGAVAVGHAELTVTAAR